MLRDYAEARICRSEKSPKWLKTKKVPFLSFKSSWVSEIELGLGLSLSFSKLCIFSNLVYYGRVEENWARALSSAFRFMYHEPIFEPLGSAWARSSSTDSASNFVAGKKKSFIQTEDSGI